MPYHAPAHPFSGAANYAFTGSYVTSQFGGANNVDYFQGRGGFGHNGWRPNNRNQQPQDRPKSKQSIPGCSPWILVKTKLGRRFVYNPEQGESFWKFPQEVMKCVIELDRNERERRERGEKSDAEKEREELVVIQGAEPLTRESTSDHRVHADDSDEYEEVEVTDDEDEESTAKRLKLEGNEPDDPVEFNEDDMAYQLALMGQASGDQGGEEGWEENYEEEPLSEEDALGLFKDLLEDFHISPYTPWETIIEEGKIIDDERYTCLSTMKARKEAWTTWTKDKIQQLKEQRERQEKKDPRIPYLAFLQKNATPKLYWPEFKRKFKKEPEMRDTKLPDKDREKWYRDYINRNPTPSLPLSQATS